MDRNSSRGREHFDSDSKALGKSHVARLEQFFSLYLANKLGLVHPANEARRVPETTYHGSPMERCMRDLWNLWL